MENAGEIRVVVACHNASGAPDFFAAWVRATGAQYAEGEHYDAARGAALDAGHEGPCICFDERDGPGFLFRGMDWERAASVTAGEGVAVG